MTTKLCPNCRKIIESGQNNGYVSVHIFYDFDGKTDADFMKKLAEDMSAQTVVRVDDDCVVMDIPQNKIAELAKVERIFYVEVSISWLYRNSP